MGLAFSVGNPSDAFAPDYAERVRSRLAQAFGSDIVLDSPEEAYRSDECGWGGWTRLQEAAANALGEDRIPHLLSMEAWKGCYVPVPTEPTAFRIKDHSEPLKVASLPTLVNELEAVGAALGLATDDVALRALAAAHEDDEPGEYDLDYQTFAELLLAAHIGQSRRQCCGSSSRNAGSCNSEPVACGIHLEVACRKRCPDTQHGIVV